MNRRGVRWGQGSYRVKEQAKLSIKGSGLSYSIQIDCSGAMARIAYKATKFWVAFGAEGKRASASGGHPIEGETVH